MLLFSVRGPTSFVALKTFNGIVYTTYHETCEARGMLLSDNQWIATLDDAVLSKHPKQIRDVFAIIIVYCQPSNPKVLYERFKNDMAADILHCVKQQMPNIDYNEDIYNECLLQINNNVSNMSNGKQLSDFGLMNPVVEGAVLCNEYLRETSYNIPALQEYISKTQPILNEEQSLIDKEVMTTIDHKKPHIFYLNAAGGTGKTTLMNLLLDKVRAQGKIAIAVASSGIAATLLHGGRTVHSAFKVPLGPNPQMCNISKNSSLAEVLRQCSLIIWDECSMSNKSTLNAINNTLKEIRNNEQIMGGITVLLGGDFQQTLPVIQRGTRADIVNAALISSHLWWYVKVLPPLKKNMRLDAASQHFSETLLKLGNGTLENTCHRILIDKIGIHITSEKSLIEHVWPDIKNITNKPVQWIKEHALLAPLNVVVNKLNQQILADIPTQERTYISIDTVMEENDVTNYPIEFLNSIDLPNIPPHTLLLKLKVPVMLLRNLSPPKLCNGTRLIVNMLAPNVIEATIITGPGAGEIVMIPRIPLIPSDLPVVFKRLQFPIRICFALTINKAQGQSFETIGVDLIEECFSHGQLYIAASRATNANQIFVYSSNNSVKSIVYPEIFK